MFNGYSKSIEHLFLYIQVLIINKKKIIFTAKRSLGTSN